MGSSTFYAAEIIFTFAIFAEFAVVPAAGLALRQELSLNPFETGLAAALPAMGALLALLFALALVPAQPRTALRLGLLLLVIGGWMSVSAENTRDFLLGRALVGFGAGFFLCFIPLWADERMTAGWLLFVHCSGVLGRVSGYAAASGLAYRMTGGWRILLGSFAGSAAFAGLFICGPCVAEESTEVQRPTAKGLGGVVWVLWLCLVFMYAALYGIQYSAAPFLSSNGDDAEAAVRLTAAAQGGCAVGLGIGVWVTALLGSYRHRRPATVFAILMSVLTLVALPLQLQPDSREQAIGTMAGSITVLQAVLPVVIAMLVATVYEGAKSRRSALVLVAFAEAIGGAAPLPLGAVEEGGGPVVGWRLAWTITPLIPLLLLLAYFLDVYKSIELRERRLTLDWRAAQSQRKSLIENYSLDGSSAGGPEEDLKDSEAGAGAGLGALAD